MPTDRLRIPQNDERPVFDLYAAQMLARATEIAVRINMFEALTEPLSVAALSTKLSIGQRATEALVAVMASSGLLHLSSGILSLTDLGREYFLKDSPFFKGALFHSIPDDELAMLRDVHLQDGLPRPATARWLAGKVPDPERQAEEMHAHTFAAATTFARHPYLASVNNLLDVAGGVGTSSVAFALHNPNLNSTLMDLPVMGNSAKALAAKFGVAERVTFIGADMFKSEWKPGNDGVLFSNIFHDWERPRCLELARKAHAALRPGGRVFVVEMLLNEERNGPLGIALFSAIMLLKMEGKQLTMSELQTLLQTAGFCNVERIESFGYYSLITAQKL